MEEKIEGQRESKLISRSKINNTRVYYVKENNQEYVVKQFTFVNNPIYEALFEKEVGALKKIPESDNIVKLLGFRKGKTPTGENKGFIFLEYIDGSTLHDECYQIRTNFDRYSIVKQLLNSLRIAHENGIIHRDINPNNIMLTHDYCVKLIDFGICKIKGSYQRGTTYQFATNKYAAPEVRYGSENATERSDIYSLGAVLYFLFTHKEPPLPEQFFETIIASSGMDVELKSVLCRMTSYKPQDRFESVIDVSISLAKLFDRYLKSDELYHVSIDFSKFEFLRRNNLVVATRNNNQLLTNDIQQNFSDAYVRQRGGLYIFDGLNYSMECIYEDRIFKVTQFKHLNSIQRDKNRKVSIPINGKFLFFTAVINGNYIKNNSFELKNRIDSHAENLASTQNINSEYETQFGIWHTFIRIMIEDAKNQARRYSYSRFSERDGLLNFFICDGDYVDDELYSSDTKFITEIVSNNGKVRQISLGSFVEYNGRDNILKLKLIKRSKNAEIPLAGVICEDYGKTISQYVLQEKAIDEFRRDETYNNSNLKSILVGIEAPTMSVITKKITFLDQKLDPAQRNAVRKIIEAKDIAVIHGPPGTGKTDVIIEVVRQILKANKNNPMALQKLLIVSQSNAAIDKIIEDLDQYMNDINIIRIGHDNEKISKLVYEKYCIDTRKKLWIEDIVNKSREVLLIDLDLMGVAYSDFASYADGLEQINIVNTDPNDKLYSQADVDEFNYKYQNIKDSKNLQQLLIRYYWIKHLSESSDIEEYFIKGAVIVTGTCSGFIANKYIADLIFDYVIIDEAAKATLPEMMVSLVRANKVVLVGDHLQLPPMFDHRIINRAKNEINIEDLKKSGFRRIFENLPNDCCEKLTTQYRMHPCIGNMISEVFYNKDIQNGISSDERELKLQSYGHNPIVWVSTSQCEYNTRHEQLQKSIHDTDSYFNPLEVQVIIEYLQRLEHEMVENQYSIGIITPYRAQLSFILKRLKPLTFSNLNIEVNTVDAFQGSQRDIILYSTVRSSYTPKIGFLSECARLNVSFSRARYALFVIGDLDFLDNENIPNNKFPEIIKYIRNNESCCKIIQYEVK